ncbi:Serine/threonine-protein kinase gad8 [Achaetomium macrosporum]|uniref:non-specific serine/threonine protein kinase n=1 Tax=Achaetomium macrosporum TaxID=79813 RepID=A0AAN7HEW4_9PEZI|nr:Serine/threonine-protein kinase gad8 [Achaetomium macrosporum]
MDALTLRHIGDITVETQGELSPARVDSGDSGTSTPRPPGILTLILHETEDGAMSSPDYYQERYVFPDHGHDREYRERRCRGCNKPYALVDYDKCQRTIPVWVGRRRTCKFDVVSHFAELAIFLYLQDWNASRGGRGQDMFVGAVRVDPVEALGTSGAHSGAQIRFSVEYQHTGSRGLDVATFECMSYGEILRKEDTQQAYLEQRLPASDVTPSRYLSHLFIAPLFFSLRSMDDDDKLHLLSPLKHFDLERARFYIAEILCALEYLHHIDGVFSWLKPRNVFVDSAGHALCGSDLFKRSGIAYESPEYPASKADWWTLGVFLYEMLTGLPPFYDADYAEKRFLTASDVMAKLLDRRPSQRLGGRRGVIEMKAHPFFDSIDRYKPLQWRYLPPFNPSYIEGPEFEQRGVIEPRPKFQGFEHNRSVLIRTARSDTNNAPAPEILQLRVLERDDRMQLAWDTVSGKFYFYDHSTGTKEPIPFDIPTPSRIENSKPPLSGTKGLLILLPPRQSQKEDFLEAALQAGYDGVVSQLLEKYGTMGLNIQIFATEQEDARLLPKRRHNRGQHQGEPALTKAVEKGNPRLVKLLVAKTDRVARTRASGLAVDRRDMAAALLSLAEGVRCEFEVGDRPLQLDPEHHEQVAWEPSEPAKFIPPLVRAGKHGDILLARELLAYDTDPNVGYHD